MDIEGLRKAVTDKRFILSANPDWREGRACGLTDDKTEQKANDALTIILENIAELVVAYLIDDCQSVKSEEVAISKTETTSEPCEYCRKPIYLKWNVSFIDGYYKLNDDCNYCPNCGRRLACTE